jgi:hypothetical protein
MRDVTDADLAGSLRSWRERLAPEEAGLPVQARRRAPGLCREEVAMLAGVSSERNVLWRHFSGMPSRVVRTPEEAAAMEEEGVADLHAALGRHPDDPVLLERIAQLRALSPRFEELCGVVGLQRL